MRRRMLVWLTMGLLCIACKSTIDGSSDEGFKKSVEELKESLPEDQRVKFEKALVLLAFKGAGPGAFGLMQKDELLAKIRDKLGGLTAAEVIELGTMERKKLLQAKIAELEQKQKDDESVLGELAKIEVSGVSFRLEESSYSSSATQIAKMGVKNGTDKTISGLSYTLTLKSVDREVPWGTEKKFHGISGGLEPGEQATWENELSGYHIKIPDANKIPDGAELFVSITEAYGAAEQNLFGKLQFDDYDKARLIELKDELKAL